MEGIMSDFITLTCPSCGSKLQITDDIDTFVCASCKNEHIVNRSGGVITLKPVIEGIKGVKVGVDKTASELAIKRLEEEIPNLERKIKEISEHGDPGCALSLFSFAGWLIIPAGIVGVIVAITSSGASWGEPGRHTSGIFAGLGLFLLTIFYAIVLFSVKKGWNERESLRIEEEKKPLLAELNKLREELLKHKKIVSN
jgi:predicted RNA-binding Zn-ribbon protein involved in translation (DUF1610 family)